MKLTLADRVEIILKDLEISQVKLAELAECTKGAVNQWLKSSKPDSMMSPAQAYAISDKTGYEPRWLMIGTGPKLKNSQDLADGQPLEANEPPPKNYQAPEKDDEYGHLIEQIKSLPAEQIAAIRALVAAVSQPQGGPGSPPNLPIKRLDGESGLSKVRRGKRPSSGTNSGT